MAQKDMYLASKPRYEILDGLRGVGALLIVAYHLFETYSSGPMDQVINHGYLAVDFFFTLSGFVIGYAYDDRWNKMSTWGFFKRRLIRLHPMVIFGCSFGALMFYFTGCMDQFPLVDQTHWSLLLLVYVWCCTIIPLPGSMDIRGWMETNPLNGAVWSLQWEYIANALYALIIRKLSIKWLSFYVALFSLMTICLCFNLDWMGVLGERTAQSFSINGGWSLTPDQLLVGSTRLLYPFFTGLLISKIKKFIQIKGGFWFCSALIALLLIMPRLGGNDHYWVNGLYECLIVLTAFPLIVSIGAGSQVSGRSLSICKFLGEISYPLYITHFPLIYMQKSWVYYHPEASIETHVAVAVSIFILSILNAWASYKLYDLPIREWLKKHI